LSKKEALRLAQQKELDLVLVAEKANPPVAKIIDFHKFLYQQKRKEKEARKKAKKSVVKDLKISLFMAENDKNRFIRKAQKFLKAGFQVKFNLVLKGRQKERKKEAINLLRSLATAIEEAKIVLEPKVEGHVARMVLASEK